MCRSHTVMKSHGGLFQCPRALRRKRLGPARGKRPPEAESQFYLSYFYLKRKKTIDKLKIQSLPKV